MKSGLDEGTAWQETLQSRKAPAPRVEVEQPVGETATTVKKRRLETYGLD
jgi:hypothetical protein